jgi:hypothetical protein
MSHSPLSPVPSTQSTLGSYLKLDSQKSTATSHLPAVIIGSFMVRHISVPGAETQPRAADVLVHVGLSDIKSIKSELMKQDFY